MIRNQLYPYIEQYINEYLYGFTKEQMELAITQGKLELNQMVIRPDKINSIMDESNVAFWLKAGIIKHIHLAVSLMNLIGETPLEVNIDGINMVLSPSYKWINKNKKNLSMKYTKKNPIGLNLDSNEDSEINFDVSIFNKQIIEEVFKDKTLISNIINSLFKGLYTFYTLPNFAVMLKINNINIKIEDDELFNYEGNFSLSIKIKSIIMKMGFKGNTKKNSLKIENFAVVWDTTPNLLITNKVLNKSMLTKTINDDYYQKVKDLDYNLIKDFSINDNTKYIIDNFNMTINFGTQNTDSQNKDIFKVQEEFKKCYFQISSNELIINLYPEFMNYINYFSNFNSNFSVIEKIKDHRPNSKPSDLNVDKKLSTRNWLHYFVWAHKIQNRKTSLHENPIRAEFNRFYNIYHKKVDALKLLKILKEKKELKNKDNNKENDDINKKEPEPQKPTLKDDEICSYEDYILVNNLDKNSDKSKKLYENYKKDLVNKKYSNFSSTIEVLLKGMVINMHPSINRNVDIKNSIIINLSNIELKLGLSPDQFNFNLGLGSLDIGPSDRIYAERVILCPTSYRENISNKDNESIIPNNNLIITPGNDNDINSVNDIEKREAGLTGLMKKYNPNYEDKIKIIDDALSKIEKAPTYNISISPTKKKYFSRGRNKLLNSYETPIFNSNTVFKKTYEVKEGEDFISDNAYSKPRNTSFTKNIISKLTETDMNLKNKIKKQKNELKISQAINNYNSNLLQKSLINSQIKNLDNYNLEKSLASINLKFSNKFLYTSKKNYYKSNNISLNKGNKTPHNLLEVYSNSSIGALKLKYIKYNNSFSLDDFSIQLGTIRFNSFYQYFIDMITILKDYQKSNNKPEIKKSYVHSTDGGGMDGNKILLKLRQDFIKALSQIHGKEKTETIKEYIEYLKKENNKLLTFSKDIDSKPFFEINYLFSYFPKGIKFYFDYENFEGVYYNKMEKMMGKFMISPYNINISISLSKIIMNLFGINIEINNLMESKILIEKLMEQCKKMLEDKTDMMKIIIEPCYNSLKNELSNENQFDDSIVNNIKNMKKEYIGFI